MGCRIAAQGQTEKIEFRLNLPSLSQSRGTCTLLTYVHVKLAKRHSLSMGDADRFRADQQFEEPVPRVLARGRTLEPGAVFRSSRHPAFWAQPQAWKKGTAGTKEQPVEATANGDR